MPLVPFNPRAAVVSEFLRQLSQWGNGASYPILIIMKRLAPTFGVDMEFYLRMLKLLEDSGDVLRTNIGDVNRWQSIAPEV